MIHDSVHDITGGDPRLTAYLKAALTQLAGGDDPLMREMATGVLDGSLDLRQAATSDAYSPSFTAASGAFWTYYENLDENQRQELVRHAEEQLDELPEQP
jgi:hypothetical protein